MNISKKIIALGLAISAAGLVGCASSYQQESAGQYIDNSLITTKVKAKLAADPDVSSLPISVESYKNTVQLSGFVTSNQQKQKVIADAKSVPGVTKVVDSMVIKAH
jgi:osmotically-inducible protein OsmY